MSQHCNSMMIHDDNQKHKQTKKCFNWPLDKSGRFMCHNVCTPFANADYQTILICKLESSHGKKKKKLDEKKIKLR